MNVGTEFLSSAIKRFREYKMLGEKAMNQLKEEDLINQPNEASNSIAVIVQHLYGNMLSRWTNFLTEDGEKEWRKRDAEFEVDCTDKEALYKLWNKGWQTLLDALESLTEDDLLKTITIRSQPLLVIDAINRQLAHYSYHAGQIVYLARWIKRADWQTLSVAKGALQLFTNTMRQKQATADPNKT